MENALDARKVPPHGMFFMEGAGGCHSKYEEAEEHHPSCFALEEEKGNSWSGIGAARPLVKEARPTL